MSKAINLSLTRSEVEAAVLKHGAVIMPPLCGDRSRRRSWRALSIAHRSARSRDEKAWRADRELTDH